MNQKLALLETEFEQPYRERQRARRTTLMHLIRAMKNASQDRKTSLETKEQLESKIKEALATIQFINREVGDLHDKQE